MSNQIQNPKSKTFLLHASYFMLHVIIVYCLLFTVYSQGATAASLTTPSLPIGSLEIITDTQLSGWACDPDKPDQAIKVYVWQYGPRASGSYSKDLGLFLADKPREAAVKTACNSSTANHGFVAAIPVHDPIDLFYVYAQNIDASGTVLNYPPLDTDNYIQTSALTASPSYRLITTDGATDRPSTKAGHSNSMVTDGTYIYTQVLRGHFDDPTSPTTTYPGYNGIIDIVRAPVNSPDRFVTIWSKKGIFSAFANLFIDTHGALHIMYVECIPPGTTSGCNLGNVKYIKSGNPRAVTPTFIDQPSPDTAVCSTCRWTILYDRATDIIHFTDNVPYGHLIERRWYTYKKTTDPAWSTKELVYTSNTVTVANGDTAADYFFYPHLIIFNGMMHIFVTGNIFDPKNAAYNQFNGIRHYYKPLGASMTNWSSEWLEGPVIDTSIHSFEDDVVITPQNKLIVLGSYSSGGGLTSRKAIFYTSATGHGDWQKNVFLPYSNIQGCLETTSDGMLHAFYQTPGNFLGYARSKDGVSWEHYQLPPPAGMQLHSLVAPNCGSFAGSASISTPVAAAMGLLTTQTVDPTRFPSFIMPQGHTVGYLELPSSALPLPMLTVTKTGTGINADNVTGQGISCGRDCTEPYAYGTQVTLTAVPETSTFTSWSGSCIGTSPTCTLKMDMNRTAQAAFTLIIDATPPAISLTAPTSGSSVSGSVTVSANASDPVVPGQTTSGIASVQFKLDGSNLGAEDTASPYSISWDTTLTTNGSHTLTARARDAAGNTTTSSGIALTVKNSDIIPSSAIISTTTLPSGASGCVEVPLPLLPGIADPCSSPAAYIQYWFYFGLYLAGLAALVAIVVAGAWRVFFAANPESTKKADRYIVNAVLGLILLFGSWLLLTTLGGKGLTALKDPLLPGLPFPGATTAKEGASCVNTSDCTKLNPNLRWCINGACHDGTEGDPCTTAITCKSPFSCVDKVCVYRIWSCTDIIGRICWVGKDACESACNVPCEEFTGNPATDCDGGAINSN